MPLKGLVVVSPSVTNKPLDLKDGLTKYRFASPLPRRGEQSRNREGSTTAFWLKD
jgi:hypothetical protein